MKNPNIGDRVVYYREKIIKVKRIGTITDIKKWEEFWLESKPLIVKFKEGDSLLLSSDEVEIYEKS